MTCPDHLGLLVEASCSQDLSARCSLLSAGCQWSASATMMQPFPRGPLLPGMLAKLHRGREASWDLDSRSELIKLYVVHTRWKFSPLRRDAAADNDATCFPLVYLLERSRSRGGRDGGEMGEVIRSFSKVIKYMTERLHPLPWTLLPNNSKTRY